MNNWKFKILKYRTKINSFANIVRAIADYAITKSGLSFVSGGLLTIQELLGLKTWSAMEVFNVGSGWHLLFNNTQLLDIFGSSLKNINRQPLEFEHEAVNLYEVGGISFISISDRYRDSSYDDVSILVKEKDKEALTTILVNEKLKELNSSYLALYEPEKDSDKLVLNKFDIKTFPSERADNFIKQLVNASEKGLKRSFLFVGLPGTGKTTIGYSILEHFKFKTLKFRPMKFFNLNTILEFIKLFKIEAVILDDMDRFEIDDQLLEFLEAINADVKLVIGICNSLVELDPALLRPGRFDEIIRIEKLDDTTIKSVLKELYNEYKDKVETFPIAYIQELYNQYILDSDLVEEKYEDLSKRVISLYNSYETKEKSEEDKEELEEK